MAQFPDELGKAITELIRDFLESNPAHGQELLSKTLSDNGEALDQTTWSPTDRTLTAKQIVDRLVQTDKLGALEAVLLTVDTIQGTVLTGAHARNINAQQYIEQLHIYLEERTYDVSGLATPYLGLDTYTYRDRAIYAGREDMVAAAARFCTQPGHERTLLFITGASGSGKSSFAQAGLIPTLEAAYREQGYPVRHAVFRPSKAPLAELARALRKLHLAADGPFTPAAPFLLDVVTAPAPPNQISLLVIDQFEELFSQSTDEQRQGLLGLLAALPPFRQLRMHVIVTMRADYLSDLFHYESLYNIAKAGIDLRVMKPEELAHAIQKPLQQTYPHAHKRFEPALLERLAADAAADAAYLPLLQVTLEDLWRGGALKLSAYDGLPKAIQKRAEQVLTDTKDELGQPITRTASEQEAMMELLLDLVEVSLDENPHRDVRRSRPIATLVNNQAQDRALIKELSDQRLLVTGLELDVESKQEQEVATIIHESLILNWPRLRAAIQTRRIELQQRSRFELALRDWRSNGKPATYLLQGVRLTEALNLKNRSDVALEYPEAQDFLTRSLAQQEAQERLRRRITSAVIAALSLLLLVALVAMWWALDRRAAAEAAERAAKANQARAEAGEAKAVSSEATAVANKAEAQKALFTIRRNEAVRYAKEAAQTLARDAVDSLALALTAIPPRPSATPMPYIPDAEKILIQAWRSSQERAYLTLSQNRLHSAQIDQGREGIAIGSDQLMVVTNGDQQLLTTTAGMGNIDGVVWGHEWLLTYDDTLLQLWRVQQLAIALVKEYRFADPIACAAWRLPDQQDLAICSGAQLWLWEAPFAGEPAVLSNQFSAPVRDVSWSSDGHWLAAWDEGWAERVRTRTPVEKSEAMSNTPEETIVIHSSLLVYNMAERSTALFSEAAHDARIWNAVWSPDNQKLVTTANDGVVRIRQVDTINRYVSNLLCAGVIDLYFLTPDRFLTWNSSGGGVLAWTGDGQLAESAEPAICVTAPDETPHINNVLFPGEGWQLHLWSDGKMELLSARIKEKVHLEGHSSPVDSAALLADRYLATGDKEGVIYIWDIQDKAPQPLLILRGHASNAHSERRAILFLQWQNDGRHLLSIGEDGTLRQWQILDQWGEPLCNGFTADGVPICFDPESAYLAHHTEINTAQWISDTAFVSVDKQYHAYRWALGQQNPFTLSTTAYAAFGLGPEVLISEIRDSKTLTPGNVVLVDPQSGALLAKLDGYDAFVTAAARHPDGQIATGEEDGRVRTWYADRTPAMERLNGDCSDGTKIGATVDCGASHANLINRVQWNRTGTRLLVSGRNVVLWDLAQPKPTPLWVWANEKGKAYAVLSDDDALVAVAVEKTIYILDGNSGKYEDARHISFESGFTEPMLGLQWLAGAQWPNQQYPPDQPATQGELTTRSLLLAWSGDGSARMWDWSIQHEVTSTTAILYFSERMGVVGEPFRITAASVSPDGKHILTAAHGFTMVGEDFNEQGILRVWRSWHTDPEALLMAAQERIRHRISR